MSSLSPPTVPDAPPPTDAGAPTSRRRRLRRSGPSESSLNLRLSAVLVSLLLLGGVLLYELERSHPQNRGTTVLPVPSLNLPSPIRHVIVIFLENQPGSLVLQNGTFERYLAEKYSFADRFHGISANSIADYMYATSGADSGSVISIPQLVDRAGETWAGYMESMPAPCDLQSSGLYYIDHNPFIFYNYVTGNILPGYCAAHVQGLGGWNASVAAGTLPNYVFITPNMNDDAHNTSISYADLWLHGFLSPFLNSSLFASSVVFVTYDSNASEGGIPANGNGRVYFVAISPYAHLGYTSQITYNDFNLLTTTEWLLGLGHTNHNDNWAIEPPMTDLFDFAPTYAVEGTVTFQNAPIVGAFVNGSGYAVPTDPAGAYALTLPNGTYAMSAARPDGSCASPPTTFTVAGSNSTVNFALAC